MEKVVRVETDVELAKVIRTLVEALLTLAGQTDPQHYWGSITANLTNGTVTHAEFHRTVRLPPSPPDTPESRNNGDSTWTRKPPQTSAHS
jgi:hypothetical protein